MSRLVLVIIVTLTGQAVVLVNAPPLSAASAPAHNLIVTGTGVASYPAFDPALERYAVTTTAATDGTITVQATTDDPSGVVRINGRVAPGGVATVTGLLDGDEVSVFIEDSAGVAIHSLFYLPAGFPALEEVSSKPGLAPGQIGLTLNPFNGGPWFVTTVDRHGVPSHVLAARGVGDLKDQPNGSITYSERPTATPGDPNSALVEMDEQWREVARHRTVGLVDTDAHDSILQPDGSSWLLAYEPNQTDGHIDSVIQELDAAGHRSFQWSSDGLEGESVVPAPTNGAAWDYAHINSLQVLGNGDVIASFRHLSAVLRIATRTHDGYQPGDIVWRLGGRDSDFTFIDDPYGGPCAQHTASVLPNGHVLIFDDGSGPPVADMCVDPAHPDGPFVARPQSRATEYALDTVAGTATLVWSYEPSGWYTWYMGSASRLANGNTLLGWAAEVRALATEVSPDGELLWQLRLADPAPTPPPISYRASLMRARDAEPPVIDSVSPADGATYTVGQQATVDFSCTDRGGASLRTCGGDLRPGGSLDTSIPGLHKVYLIASDGAGNTTTVTRTYTVNATYRPQWTNDRRSILLDGNRASTRVTVMNAGTYADTFALLGPGGNPRLGVRYKVGRTDVTDLVRRGTLSTSLLQPGQSFVLRVIVSRTDRAQTGAHQTLRVRATSLGNRVRDVVTVVVRAR